MKQLNHQQTEAETLHCQLSEAGAALAHADETSSAKLSAVLSEEKTKAEDEQATLISQITTLVHNQTQAREKRLEVRVASLQSEISASHEAYRHQQITYDNSMAMWSTKQASLVDDLLKSRESVKSKIKKDWTVSHLSFRFPLQSNNHSLQMSTTHPFRRRHVRFRPKLSTSLMHK